MEPWLRLLMSFLIHRRGLDSLGCENTLERVSSGRVLCGLSHDQMRSDEDFFCFRFRLLFVRSAE